MTKIISNDENVGNKIRDVSWLKYWKSYLAKYELKLQ